MTETPTLLSVLLDVEAAEPQDVEASLLSVLEQKGVDIEVLVHGAAAPGDLRDDRVCFLDGEGTAGDRVAQALAAAAGEFSVFLGAGETFIGPHVLASVVDRVSDVGADLLYADEIVVDEAGAIRVSSKPMWSPARLVGQNWLGRPVFLRTALATAATRDEPLAQDWEHDLWLRVLTQLRAVERLDGPILHGRHRAATDARVTVELVRGHVERTGVPAMVTSGPSSGTAAVVAELPVDLSVTVVIPTDGSRGTVRGERCTFVVEAVRSVLARSRHPRLDVVVVQSAATSPSVCAEVLALGGQVRLVDHEGPFHHAAMANRGVLSSTADVVVVVDQHAWVRSDGFVERLTAPLCDTGVGATGPRVLASNGRLLDGGLALHLHRVQPMFAGTDPEEPGPGGLLGLTRECAGLNGMCLALRRQSYLAVGGLCERLPVTYDVDLSYKLRRAGLRRLWVPAATVRRVTPPDRTESLVAKERKALRHRWLGPEQDEYVPAFGLWRAERERAEMVR